MSFPDSEMQETLSVENLLGESAVGPVYDSAVEISAYVEQGFRKVTNAQGQEVIASALAIIPADSVVAVGARVIHDSRQYEVVDIQKFKPGGTIHHIELSLKSAAW